MAYLWAGKNLHWMRILYQLFVWIYWVGSGIAARFSPKVKLWRKGRKGQFSRMQAVEQGGQPLAWFHCASLGEFEQGRPVIEAFRGAFPDYRILLTFFSPSGYEIRKNYEQADYVFYLPFDTPGQVKRFFESWDPVVAVFVKYEFWFNFFDTLFSKGIPSLVISANFRPDQHFFKPYGGWFRRQLRKLSFIFVQNQASLDLLHEAGIENAAISGDTRFDRVAAIAERPVAFPQLKAFTEGHQILVAGSTWPADEEMLLPLIKDEAIDLKYIIAPHEIHVNHIAALKTQIGERVEVFSEIQQEVHPQTRVLIINRIGLLSGLYRLGTMAYIGGGFGRGIHNILEAVTFGLPVFFGPRYHTFAEAVELQQRGGAFPVREQGQLREGVKALLEKPGKLQGASAICREFIEEKKGATRIIIDYLRVILA